MERTQYREHSSPLFLSSSFVYDSAEHAAAMFAGEGEGDIYSRFTNPNTTELINKLCSLEMTASGVVTASGMAAIFASLAAYLQQGDHLLASNSLFGNSLYIIKNILPKWGISYSLVDLTDVEQWRSSFKSNTRMVLVESPSNPGLDLIDIQWLANECKRHKVILNVDNCFATPILQKPALFGAELITHSATKFIDGQGRILGGAVLGSEERITPIFDFLRRTGPSLSAFNAWLLSKSLETLDLRMERHCNNALQLASFLEGHKRITAVKYPFLPSHPQYELAKKQMKMGGGIVSLEVAGGQEACFRLINDLSLPSITANLGDTRTIVTHPSTTTHSKLQESERKRIGITDGTLRVSVGLEDIGDIMRDFELALSRLK